MKEVVTFGEIMLRLAAPDYNRLSQASQFVTSFCGAEANVAVSLANFGIAADFVSRLPCNDVAEACLMQLKMHGVGIEHLLRGGDRLGLFYLETGSGARPSKVIYDRVYSSFSAIRPGMVNWEDVFRNASWFHWTGITPALSQSAAETCHEAVTVASKMGICISCDLNFRSSLWGTGSFVTSVMQPLVAQCDVIMGNEEDCAKVFHIRREGCSAGADEARDKAFGYEAVLGQMTKRFPKCKFIALSIRDSINANHNIWQGVMMAKGILRSSRSYDITDIVDRVGAGDAFAGGLIFGLLKFPEDGQRVIDFATAASCLKHTIHGDFNRVTIDEVLDLVRGEGSGRIHR